MLFVREIYKLCCETNCYFMKEQLVNQGNSQCFHQSITRFPCLPYLNAQFATQKPCVLSSYPAISRQGYQIKICNRTFLMRLGRLCHPLDSFGLTMSILTAICVLPKYEPWLDQPGLICHQSLSKRHHKNQNETFSVYRVCIFCAQGHSRRGNCLLPLKRKKDALRAFCKAHTNAVTEREKQATAQEVITTAMGMEGWLP